MKTKIFILMIISTVFISAFVFAQKTLEKTSSKKNTISSNVQLTDAQSTNMAAAIKKKSLPKKASFINHYFKLGGVFMWPLLILSIAGLGITLERWWFFYKRKLNISGFTGEIIEKLKIKGVDEAIEHCHKEKSNISGIILSGLLLREEGLDRVEKTIETNGGIEISMLERGLSILSAIANLAPLLGFLGTVTGMIAAFQAIATADTVSAKLVSVGIFEALITTAVGLIVAIPSFASHNIFVHKIDKFATEVEKSSSQIIHSIAIINRSNNGVKTV